MRLALQLDGLTLRLDGNEGTLFARWFLGFLYKSKKESPSVALMLGMKCSTATSHMKALWKAYFDILNKDL